MKCPKCSSTNEFTFVATQANAVKYSAQRYEGESKGYDVQTVKTLDYCEDWSLPDDDCTCEACDYQGTVKEFADDDMPVPIGNHELILDGAPDHLAALQTASVNVLENWEGGDLAAAVRELARVLKAVKGE